MNALQQAKLIFRKTNFVLAGFFIAVLLLVFIGDGKQSLAEATAGMTAVLLWACTKKQGKSTTTTIGTIDLLWKVVFGVWFLSSWFSDSRGYSLSAFARLLSGYLIFWALYYEGKKSRPAIFIQGLQVLGIVVLVFTFFYSLAPNVFREFASPLLLYATSGHNHAADIYMFVFPTTVFLFFWQKSKTMGLLTALLALGLLLTFARGALLLLCCWVVLLVLTQTKPHIIKQKLLLLSIAALSLLLILLVSRNNEPFFLSSGSWWQRQTQKPLLIQNERRWYWKQGIQAFIERPLLGSGPGTFYLQSLRLQESSSQHATYAHNTPLQLLAETGIIGFLPFTLLIAFLLKTIITVQKNTHNTKEKKETQALAWATTLSFFYGFIEYNLDILAIWLLFWGTCGYVLGLLVPRAPESHKPTHVQGVAAWTLLAYSLFLSLGAFYMHVLKNTRTAFLFTPFRANSAVGYLQSRENSTDVSLFEKKLILFFHAKNPGVLFALAQNTDAKESPTAAELYERTLAADPQNVQFYRSYMRHLLSEGFNEKAQATTSFLTQKLLEAKTPTTYLYSTEEKYKIASAYSLSTLDSLGGTTEMSQTLAKIHYLLGAAFVDRDPTLTRLLWVTARDLSPEWEYYHLELAALEQDTFKNITKTRLVLAECQLYYYPARTCALTNTGEMGLLPVGSLKDKILTIPYINHAQQ